MSIGRIFATLFVAGIVYSATITQARADFIVRVDNQSSPSGATSWSAPQGQVFIYIKWKNSTTQQWEVPNSNTIDTFHDLYVSGHNYSDVLYIQVYNTGNDMFGIDRLHALSTSYGYLHSWGTENAIAWCVSTDVTDGYAGDCNTSVACDGWNFYPNDSVVGVGCT